MIVASRGRSQSRCQCDGRRVSSWRRQRERLGPDTLRADAHTDAAAIALSQVQAATCGAAGARARHGDDAATVLRDSIRFIRAEVAPTIAVGMQTSERGMLAPPR